MDKAICRICLNNHIQSIIADRELQELYERLTEIPLQTRSPLALCYICHAQLNTTRRLMLKCLKAEKMLNEMLSQMSNEAEDVKPINRSTLNELVVSSVELFSIDSTVENIGNDIKEEKPMLCVQVKMEEESAQDIPETADTMDSEPENRQSLSDTEKKSQLNNIRSERDKKAEGEREEEHIGLGEAPNAEMPKVDPVNISMNELKHVSADPSEPNCYNKIHQGIKLDNKCRTIEDFSPGNKRYICDYCDTVCTEKGTLVRHIRLHTGERPYVCNVCEKTFNIKNHLVIHSRLHTGERPYVCDVCNKCFSAQSNLIRHSRAHTQDKRHACNVCDKTFLDRSTLKIHSRLHTGEKPYECDICNKCFTVKHALDGHKLTHSNYKPHGCDFCGLRFYTKSSLNSHMRRHNGVKSHACNYCNQRFYTQAELRTHFNRHTGEKIFICDYCKKSFKYKFDLARHIRSHLGVKNYACDVCNKSFIHISNLKSHSLTHTGVKPHVCDVCNKCFSTKSSLTRHSRVHTFKENTRIYMCDVCHDVFRLLCDYKKHLREHDNQKHVCGVCNKTLKSKRFLIRHSRTHIEKEPFVCILCNKKFKFRSRLLLHAVTHTKEKAYVDRGPVATPLRAFQNVCYPFIVAIQRD